MRLKEGFARLNEAAEKYSRAHNEFNSLLDVKIDDLTNDEGDKLLNEVEKRYVQIKWLKIKYEELEREYYVITRDLQRNGGCQS